MSDEKETPKQPEDLGEKTLGEVAGGQLPEQELNEVVGGLIGTCNGKHFDKVKI